MSKVYQATVFSNYAGFVATGVRRVIEVRVPRSAAPGNENATAVDSDNGVQSPALRNYLASAVDKAKVYGCPRPDLERYRPFQVLAGGHFTIGYPTMSALHDLKESVAVLPLEDASEPGYDRTFELIIPGGSVRVYNVGDERLGVEINVFRIYDPLGLVAPLYMLSKRTRELQERNARHRRAGASAQK